MSSLRKLASKLPVATANSGHRHFAERLFSRRSFLEKSGLTLGVLAASGLLPELSRASTLRGLSSTTTTTPVPIPGGLKLLGPEGPLFHVFLPAPGVEPSTITNFNWFIGWAAVGGMGTHTAAGKSQHLPFDSDMRFIKGEFVGTDGRNHHGAFVFI